MRCDRCPAHVKHDRLLRVDEQWLCASHAYQIKVTVTLEPTGAGAQYAPSEDVGPGALAPTECACGSLYWDWPSGHDRRLGRCNGCAGVI